MLRIFVAIVLNLFDSEPWAVLLCCVVFVVMCERVVVSMCPMVSGSVFNIHGGWALLVQVMRCDVA